jgi:FKBP-type peptidyl-prolyl cis-trans isomerase FklB
MKRLVLVAALSMTGLVWAAEPTASASFSNDEAKVAYSLGFVFGKNNAAAIENLNVEQFVAGFKDGYAGKAGLLTEEDLKKTLNENKARSQAFLADNAKKQGVVTTATGLQYEVITQGTGVQPKSTDTVEVHYVGTLTDGTVFDSSVERGQTASFRLDQVIAGWTEGVQLMKQGSKYRFTIPSELAYGESGAGAIPANAVLVFEVELIKVTQEQSATTTTTKTDKKAKKK